MKIQVRIGRLLLGFWPRQQWLRVTRERYCPCCAWNFYVGPFGMEWWHRPDDSLDSDSAASAQTEPGGAE